MNCVKAQKLFCDALDDALSERDRHDFEKHLAHCHRCQAEFNCFIRTQQEINTLLRKRAESVSLSSDMWERIQVKLALKNPSSPFDNLINTILCSKIIKSFHGGLKMKARLTYLFLSLSIIVIALAVFVPVVQGQVGEWLRWFRFESPAGGGEVSIPGEIDFIPLKPTYLPPGFKMMAVGLNPETASLNYWNSETQQILIIEQRLRRVGETLPEGDEVFVLDQPARLLSGINGEITFVAIPPTPVEPMITETPTPQDSMQPLSPLNLPEEVISYTDGRRLIWYVGNTRIEMTSTLPFEEMLKIAESMTAAQEE